MNAKAIQDVLSIKPFEPAVLVLSSGDRYLVRHPENIILYKERVLISWYEKPDNVELDPGELPDRFTSVSYLHVAAIEPAPRPQKRQSVQQ